MPTREVLASFWRDWDRLTPQQQRAFRQALTQFIADVASGDQSFHPRLRVPWESPLYWSGIGAAMLRPVSARGARNRDFGPAKKKAKSVA